MSGIGYRPRTQLFHVQSLDGEEEALALFPVVDVAIPLHHQVATTGQRGKQLRVIVAVEGQVSGLDIDVGYREVELVG